MKTPPCATWKIWTGVEIEGTASSGRGIKTLFIRELPSSVTSETDLSFLSKSQCERIWFCKEFTNWRLIEAISLLFKETCIEVEPKCFDSVPKSLRMSCRIFLKVNTPLKRGDVVCVGLAFNDESFQLGYGNKVKPEAYLMDRKIQ